VQNHDQQHQRVAASDVGRKLWQDRDPYNRQPQQQDDRRLQLPHQQQAAGSGYMTHEQRFESMQRSSGTGGMYRGGAVQQLHSSADPNSQYRPMAWSRPHDAHQQQLDGYHASGAADDDVAGLGEGIAVGDDYSRAQQGSSAPHMLYNHRTNSFEPTQAPPKEAAPRSQLQQRGWGIPLKTKAAGDVASPVSAPPARSILKAPAVPSSARAVDPKSLREEARFFALHQLPPSPPPPDVDCSTEREQRRRLSGRPADFISLGLTPSVKAPPASAAVAAAAAAADSVPFMDETGADESRYGTHHCARTPCLIFMSNAITHSFLQHREFAGV
jgi:hypothetical protein